MFVYLASTCQGSSRIPVCATPEPGSNGEKLVNQVRSEANFPLLYPCYLPNPETIQSASVTGAPGKQSVDIVWKGPFNFTLRQNQYPPAVSPDPSGSEHTKINLFSDTPADLIEQYDASGPALYDLYWERDDIYYELQVYGPPQQRDTVLKIARSLQ